MSRISVVVETVTSRSNPARHQLADALGPTLASLRRQTHQDFETLVVVDDLDDPEVLALRRLHPAIRVVAAERHNYFVMKNRGAAAANGEIVAYIDGDCEADERWLDCLVARFDHDIALVAGRSSYPRSGAAGRTSTITDFGVATGDAEGGALGLLLSNVAVRRDVLLSHPLEERLPRNGGCYLLYNQLRVEGARMLFEPDALVIHGFDAPGLGFVRKHFDRGYDGMLAYRLDYQGVLRGTRLVRRVSGLALVPITARRVGQDWRRLFQDRRHLGVWRLPSYAAAMLVVRLIEAVGGLAGSLSRLPADPGGVTNPRLGAF